MNNIVAVVFSYNRPLQLDLLLNSLKQRCLDYDKMDVKVLYRADQKFEKSYNQCYEESDNVLFVKEDNFQDNFHQMFKDYEYILFLTDDSIIINDFSIVDILDLLKQNKELLGFSLRLGRNLDYCYSLSKDQVLPVHSLNNDIMTWEWMKGEYDWGYPLEVSSSVYRVPTIEKIHYSCSYINPRFLEYFLHTHSKMFQASHPLMACYKNSSAFSAPVNTVGDAENKKGSQEKYTVDNLLKIYEEGARINPDKFSHYFPKSVHEEVEIL